MIRKIKAFIWNCMKWVIRGKVWDWFEETYINFTDAHSHFHVYSLYLFNVILLGRYKISTDHKIQKYYLGPFLVWKIKTHE